VAREIMTENHGNPIIIKDVTKSYRSKEGPLHALAQTSLNIGEGEFVSIVGPSGCGKSTLLMIVAGLVSPSSGTVAIGGTSVTSPYTNLGLMFQRPVLLDWRTVLDNVLVQLELRGIPREGYVDRARELLGQMGLSGFERRHPHELSGGMQQRVALCRSLIHDPPILLMDEPFAALDALTRDQLTLDLQELWAKTRKTVLFITHSISEALFLSDKVVVFTPRPGMIDETISVDLPRPRRLVMRESPAFLGLSRHIENLFLKRGVLREKA
jgi:NitT/TauT family transport system ATP-binding protein